MTIHKKGQAHWEGDIKGGKGTVSTDPALCFAVIFIFARFRSQAATN